MSDTESEDLNDLTIKELKEQLKAFPEAKKSAKDKAELVQRLSDYMHRREVLGELGRDYLFFWITKSTFAGSHIFEHLCTRPLFNLENRFFILLWSPLPGRGQFRTCGFLEIHRFLKSSY